MFSACLATYWSFWQPSPTTVTRFILTKYTPLLCRETPKDHLAAKGCPGLVVESNYSICGDDPMLLTSLYHGVPNCTAAGAAAAAAICIRPGVLYLWSSDVSVAFFHSVAQYSRHI